MGKNLRCPPATRGVGNPCGSLRLFPMAVSLGGETVVPFGGDGEEAPCPALRERRSSSPGEPAGWERGSCGPCCGGGRGGSCPPPARGNCGGRENTAQGPPAG